MRKKKNIVILMADEMRGDVLSDPILNIPNLKSLLNDGGLHFSNNFSVNPVCGPARCCLFTGQYIQNGGHRSLYQLLLPHEENLFKILKNNGYDVIWAGRNDLFNKKAGKKSVNKRIGLIFPLIKKILSRIPFSTKLKLLGEAIRVFILHKYPLDDSKIFEYLQPYMKINPFSLEDPRRKSFYFGKKTELQAELDMDNILTEKILKLLNSKRIKRNKKPFCLFIAFSSPHPPYTVEEPYFSMYSREFIKDLIPSNFKEKPGFMKIIHDRYNLNKLDSSFFKEIRATYYGMISKLDNLIGKIIQQLKTLNLYNTTSIIFTADHGDFAGDYGLTEKWPNAMQDCLINVPLIIRIPNILPKFKESFNLVQSIDIFPTILDILNISTNYTHFGKSLIPLIKGHKLEHRNFVFAGGGYDEREPQCFEHEIGSEKNPFTGIYFDKINIQNNMPELVCRTQMIRTEKWKLILRSKKEIGEELYNLQEDPNETTNLFYDINYNSIVLDLKDKLLNWNIETSDNPSHIHKREI